MFRQFNSEIGKNILCITCKEKTTVRSSKKVIKMSSYYENIIIVVVVVVATQCNDNTYNSS